MKPVNQILLNSLWDFYLKKFNINFLTKFGFEFLFRTFILTFMQNFEKTT